MIKCDFKDSDRPQIQIEASLDLLDKINILQNTNEPIALDFSDVRWILPCSALLLSSRLSEIIHSGKKIVSLRHPKDQKVLKFLSDIGFPMGTKNKKTTHCPITHFTGGNLNKQVSNVLESIKPSLDAKFGDSISYLVGDLSDNISDHSNFTYASLMAQYYPKKGYIDIGILDNGLTIPGAFESALIGFKDDCEAIKMAMEGTSTKNEFDGRGWGLRTSKRIAIEGLNGEMHIYSRGGGILIKPRNKKEEYLILQKNPLNGTLIYMRLYVPKKRLNIGEYIS